LSKAFAGRTKPTRRALLFYNEVEGEGMNQKSDGVYAMVKDFKQRGVPIDGVGLQWHISNLDYDADALATNMARLTALGLQVHITELDVFAAGQLSWSSDGRGPAPTSQCVSQGCEGLPQKSGVHGDPNMGLHR
jgi:GH35 family endo-1,4-beta-xylanase